MNITFEQFQATRTWYADLSQSPLSDASLEGISGFLYVDGLYIDAATPTGPEFHLQLCQDEQLSKNLEELERKLYEYGCDEGHCDIVPTPEALAAKFETILRSWLDADQWQVMRDRNAAETSPNVCHSHDFCDANMAMDEAWTSFGLPSIDADDEAQAKLWNDAWNIFKAAKN